jgi:hypothetical protein
MSGNSDDDDKPTPPDYWVGVVSGIVWMLGIWLAWWIAQHLWAWRQTLPV